MEKLKNFWKVITQPTGIKIVCAVLGACGLNPAVATAVTELIPVADQVVQGIGALVAGGIAVNELAKDETKKKLDK